MKFIFLLLLLWALPARAATLYVNVATGNDATSKASNNSGSPWASIYRAAKGCAVASSPCSNSGEAAAAGDIVLITGGTYNFAGTVNDRFDPVYSPINDGSVGNLITFTCVGTCTLTGNNAKAPAIGSNSKDYIKWYADVSLGHSWTITACGEEPPSGTHCVGGSWWTGVADTGPVTCANSAVNLWVEGLRITSILVEWEDNWSAVRVNGCTGTTVRNLWARDFRNAANLTPDASCMTIYASVNGLFEHIDCADSGNGMVLKDTAASQQSGNVLRYWKVANMRHACFAYSHVDVQARNDIYQNTCNVAKRLIGVTGTTGLTGDYIYNNTGYNFSENCAYLGSGTGARVWNNICHTASPNMISVNGGTMPSGISFQHNNYFSFTAGTFYNGSDGNRTFDSYKTAFSPQDATSPGSITSDPLFVNLAAGNFRLSSGSPALTIGVNPNTSASVPAGAYITGDECIGLTSDCNAVGLYFRLRNRKKGN